MPVKVVKAKKTTKPSVEAPSGDVPIVDTPSVEAPAVEVPAVEVPAVEAPAVEESSSEILFKKLNAQFQDLVVVMKTIQANLKVLEKEVAKDRKELQKKCKKKNDKKKASGFAVPTLITNNLSSFLGLPDESQVARTDVTSQVIAYVKSHNLQNPANKRQILPDVALATLLQAPEGDVITFFNIQTYLKKHFLPAVPQVVEQTV